MGKERDIVAKIVKKITAEDPDRFVMKVHGGRFQMLGVPDLLVVSQGKAIFIEVKQPGKKATKIQEHVMTLIRRAGGVADVAHSADEALEILAR